MHPLGPSLGHVRGTSWLHRANPLVKLTWLLAVIAVALATYDPVPMLFVALLVFAACVAAGIGGPVGRGVLIFVPVAASMLVIQTLAPAGCGATCTATAEVGPLDLYGAGMLHGLSLAARILLVEVVALGVLVTTHPSDLFAALARLRVPYLFNFMLSMTLQLVPILQREMSIVLAAQRSRGMRSSGFGAILPSFVPVFAGAFERVQQLSISLESRAFGSSHRPTSYRRIGFGPGDALLVLLGVAAGIVGVVAGLVVWNQHQAVETTLSALTAPVVLGLFGVAALIFIGVIGAGLRSLVRDIPRVRPP
jgi:energy-coupling factor transport system permease protein